MCGCEVRGDGEVEGTGEMPGWMEVDQVKGRGREEEAEGDVMRR